MNKTNLDIFIFLFFTIVASTILTELSYLPYFVCIFYIFSYIKYIEIAKPQSILLPIFLFTRVFWINVYMIKIFFYHKKDLNVYEFSTNSQNINYFLPLLSNNYRMVDKKLSITSYYDKEFIENFLIKFDFIL